MRTSANRFVRLFAAGVALLASAGAAEEASLLDRPGWVRTCDKGQLVWNDGPGGKSVTLLQEKGAKVAGFGTDFLDLDAFRDKEVDLVFVLDGDNVVRGTEADGKTPHMRGIVAGCGHSVADYEKIRGWGCNLVRFWMNPDKEGDFEKTDALLPELERLGIHVILAPATPGPRGPQGQAYRLFNDEELYNRYLENWKKVAERYKGDERIFAFDLMNEPFQELRKNPDDRYNFLAVQYEAAKIVRAIDPDRVLVASATGGSSPGNYNACDMRPLPLKDVIYQMHFYAPFFLTHAGLYGTQLLPDDPYPGTEKRGTHWTRKEVGDVMDYMNDFVERWGAQIYVGEFSCMSKQPGAAQWLDDVADLIEQHGYKFWTFHSYGEFYGWNLESIRDEETGKLRNIRDGETTDRLEVMKRHWAKNRE